jgi:hypothetical protein
VSEPNRHILGEMIITVQNDAVYKDRGFDTLLVSPREETDEIQELAKHFEIEVLVSEFCKPGTFYLVNRKRFEEEYDGDSK